MALDFFTSNWSGYEGVTEAEPRLEIVRSPTTVWVDVTWFDAGKAQERYMYQLLNGADRWRIGVLTPMESGQRRTR